MWSMSTLVPTATGSQKQAILSVVSCATAAAVWCNSSNQSLLEKAKAGSGNKENQAVDEINPIEVNLMDKIANKVYLNPSRARLQQTDSLSTTNSNGAVVVTERPLGVPSHLRILAIDLPKMRHKAFSNGDCRVAFDRVYPDGIAPPKLVERDPDNSNNNNNNNNNPKPTDKKRILEVEQKAWVKSMVQCFQKDLPDKIGVEMMEASFADLNPQNLRTTRQVGSYHYDPGKYTHETSTEEEQQASKSNTTSTSTITRSSNSSTDQQVAKNPDVTVDLEEVDELNAPWNQYAWLEEVKLRIHGHVPFGASMEPSSRWNRYISGNHYKSTVPSQRSVLQWFFPPFLQTDPQGIDGGTKNHPKEMLGNSAHNNWASQKPHVVIANGAAVQRVPSGLRLLQKACRDANVPLFVIYDPRAWGSNTHESLQQALRDVRFIVKQNIILAAMEQQSGFSRGRRIGRMERQVELWTEQARVERQRRQDALKKRQWKNLDAVSLEKRLIEHGVVRKVERVEDGKVLRQYTPAMVQIARQCVEETEHPSAAVDARSEETHTQNVPLKG